MKHLSSKDLILIFLITAIYVIIILFPIFKYETYILGFLILFFLFTGYSLISLLRPNENYRDILKKPVLILQFSIFLILSASVILKFSSLGLNLKLLIMVLAIITMVLSILSYIHRIYYFKSHERKVEITKIEKLPEKKSTQKQPKIYKSSSLIDLLIIDLLSIFTIISFFIPLLNISLLHNILGGLFMLFLSGYVTIVILLPKKGDLGLFVRLALSIGLSLPITSLVGLALYFTNYGINVNSILFSLAILTLILSVFAIIRRIRIVQSFYVFQV